MERETFILNSLEDIDVMEVEVTTFSDLTADDLASIAISNEQSRLGRVVSHQEVQKKAMERRR